MPIYTYKCKKCGNVFDKFKSMSSNGTEHCELCSSEAMRVFSPAGIIFKGSGFYSTDYKSGSGKANLNPESAKSDEKQIKKEEAKEQSRSGKSSGPESSADSGTGSSKGSDSGTSSSSGPGSNSNPSSNPSSNSGSGSGSSSNKV